MKKHNEKTARPDTTHSVNQKKEINKSKEDNEDDCRCKEVSKKTFPEMIKLMLHDLAFWKKGR